MRRRLLLIPVSLGAAVAGFFLVGTALAASGENAINQAASATEVATRLAFGGVGAGGGPTTAPTTVPATTATTVVTTVPSSGGGGVPGFPGPGTTGVDSNVPLTVIRGDYVVTTPGVVVENLHILGTLYVDAPNVTVRNVKVTCSDSWWVVRATVAGVTIQDSTLTVDRSSSSNYCQYGISAGDGAKILRNDISFTPNGLIFGNSAEVVENWIHDQIAYPGHDDHVDAAQVNGGGAGPYVFRGNHFSVPEGQTGALALFADFGTIKNVVAENNLFDGGGYSVYGGTASATDVRFVNNWFAKTFYPRGGYFGPVTAFNTNGAGNVWSNNRWLDTLQQVPPG
jgi:hypothetical protein